MENPIQVMRETFKDSFMQPECFTGADIEYEFASKVAYFALCNMLGEVLDASIKECLDLAETQIENLEGVA